MTFREIRYDVEDGVCTVMAARPFTSSRD